MSIRIATLASVWVLSSSALPALGYPIPSEAVVEHFKSLVRGECQASEDAPWSLVDHDRKTLTLFACRSDAGGKVWRGYGTFATEYGIQWVRPLEVNEYDVRSGTLKPTIDLKMDPGSAPTFYGRYNLLNLFRSQPSAADCGQSSRTRVIFAPSGFQNETHYVEVRERCDGPWTRKYEKPGGAD